MRNLLGVLLGLSFVVGCQSSTRQTDTFAADSDRTDYLYEDHANTRLISERGGEGGTYDGSSNTMSNADAYPPGGGVGSIYTRDTKWQGKPVSLRTPSDVASPEEFMRDAASAGKMEVELGRIALTHAENARVRHFGQQMVTDHTKANEDLMRIARDENISIPAQPSADHQAMIDRLSRLSGESFDKQYMDMMVDDHAADVQQFEAQANHGQDEGVRDFAERTVKMLREHLRLAREIEHDLDINATDAKIWANPTEPLP